MTHRSLLIRAGVLAAAIVTLPGALAQNRQEGPGERAQAAAVTLDTVKVTARRHAENAQAVPISMTVIEGETVDRIPTVSSNAAIARQTPNFSFVDFGGQYTNFSNVRGVGSFTVLSPDDTSVPFYVDEIPRSPLSVAPSTLDMSRIEVLRGPQGTLYGRNSQGGAVNFVPNRPEFTPGFQLRGEVGTRGWALGEVIANQPINDRLAGRLAVQYSNRDGDVSNVLTGGKDGRTRVGAARGSLLLVPDPQTSALLTFSHEQNDDTTPLWVLRNAGCFPCVGLNPINDFRRKNDGLTLRLERELKRARFTSITSYQAYRGETLMDLTDSVFNPRYLPLPDSVMNDPNADITATTYAEDLFVQEFRLSSMAGGPFMWTAGVNFTRSDYDTSTIADNITSTFYRSYAGRRWIKLKSDSLAAFGEATVPLTASLSGIAGLRLTREERHATYDYQGGAVGTVPAHHQDGRFSDTLVTGRIGLNQVWSDALMTYAVIGRGAVSGGLTTSPRNIMQGHDEPIIPTSDSLSYEAGVKSTLWDGRAILNASVFRNDVKKGRLATRDPAGGPAFIISNLDYDSYGAEVEARVRLTQGLTVFGGIGYTHARLRNVPEDSRTGGKTGNRLTNVPEWTGHVAAEFRLPAARLGLGSGQLYSSASWEYVGVRSANLQNTLDLAAYGLVNARIGWQGRSAGVYLFVNNLTDRLYDAIGASYGPDADAIRPGYGRVVGLGASLSF